MREMPPAFFLSGPQSGGSVLRSIVDTHPLICSPAQLQLAQLCEDFYRTLYYIRSEGLASPDAPARETQHSEKEIVAEVRRVVTDLVEGYASSKGKYLWCVDVPPNPVQLSIMKRLFPKARYICLYRNCLDVASLIIQTDWLGYRRDLARYVQRYPQNLVAAIVRSWIDNTRVILEFERAESAKCLRLKYESLAESPGASLEKLGSFLAPGLDGALLKSDRSWDPRESPAYRKAVEAEDPSRIGDGLGAPTRKLSGELLIEANELLRELGYAQIQ
jgi:hypothetical protein